MGTVTVQKEVRVCRGAIRIRFNEHTGLIAVSHLWYKKILMISKPVISESSGGYGNQSFYSVEELGKYLHGRRKSTYQAKGINKNSDEGMKCTLGKPPYTTRG